MKTLTDHFLKLWEQLRWKKNQLKLFKTLGLSGLGLLAIFLNRLRIFRTRIRTQVYSPEILLQFFWKWVRFGVHSHPKSGQEALGQREKKNSGSPTAKILSSDTRMQGMMWFWGKEQSTWGTSLRNWHKMNFSLDGSLRNPVCTLEYWPVRQMWGECLFMFWFNWSVFLKIFCQLKFL